MKRPIAFLSIIALLFGCNSASNNKAKDAIPGTYIRLSEHEYGREWDTLVIGFQNRAANQYKIIRRWRYERVLEGKAVEPEYKVTTTTATYNAQSKNLEEDRTGKIYTLDAAGDALFAGTSRFEKLK